MIKKDYIVIYCTEDRAVMPVSLRVFQRKEFKSCAKNALNEACGLKTGVSL